ncbi:MAG: Rne/Rng family ribonuclease [Bacillota bacterium]|nr:Rne/Rng family ribonuclease [Bacillota bacterium]
MLRDILITEEDQEPQVAIVEDGQLAALYIERPLSQRLVGNIYKGRVENVLPGMQAAFVAIGLERNAFLFVDDAQAGVADEEDALEEGERIRSRMAIQDLFRPGQEILVQVEKEPTGAKGARVTRALSIPGRYLVLAPYGDGIGISRRIADPEERDRLRQVADKLRKPPLGIIVRTVAEGRSEEELRRDWEQLLSLWQQIEKKAQEVKAPALLHKDLSVIERILRDEVDGHLRRIVVEGEEALDHASQYLTRSAPEYLPLLMDYRSLPESRIQSLFSFYGIDEELEKALGRRVWLKSGGYLVIDQMEALTTIDVNTGKYVGKTDDLQDTVFQTNLEAAREVARQIRLRDIGGIIIVDFIDMSSPEHRQRVLEELENATRYDPQRPTVLGFTRLGLVEMTRRKGRQSLRDLLTRPCPYCDGRGRVMSEETTSRRIRREMRKLLMNSDSEALLVEAYPSVAALLIGPNGANLKELERTTGRTIFIRGNEEVHLEKMRVKAMGERAMVESQALPVKVGEILEITVAEPHVAHPEDGIARLQGYVVDIEGGAARVGHKVKVEVVKVFRTYCKARLLEGQG